jgi:ubiquitin carboxyl-terminal hydrolase L3
LLRDCVPVIKKFMNAANGSIHFNAIALAANLG